MKFSTHGTLGRALNVRPQPVKLIRVKKRRTSKQKFVRSSVLVLLLLLPVTFLGDRLLAYALEEVVLESNFRYSSLYNGTAEADIIVLGNSRGHAFHEPLMEELSGKTVFNLSYNALPVSVGRVLIEDYFDRYKAELLVIDVSMLTKTETQITESFKTYQSLSPRLQQLIAKTAPETSTACDIFKFYNFNSEVFHRSLYYLGTDDDDWILDKEISKTLAEKSGELEDVSLRVTKDRMKDLQAIIAVAERNNVKVNLVMGPYFPGYLDKIENLDNFMASIESATGYEVVDYSSLLHDRTLFSDYLHVNREGSAEFLEAMYQDQVF